MMIVMGQLVLFGVSVGTVALFSSLARCYRAILNDARIISLDPALRSQFEILYAYPGFWALFWYRLSHALLERQVPLISAILPRFVMSVVRCATAIDIHPEAQISSEGILIDHGTGLVIGATAIVGGGVTLYHGVTLGGTGKQVLVGKKRHPTVGDRVVVGAGAKILGDILIGDDVLVGANSVVTKPVPANHTAVGAPARILCHGSCVGKDVTGAAICELNRRLQKVERRKSQEPTATVVLPSPTPVAGTVVANPTTSVIDTNIDFNTVGEASIVDEPQAAVHQKQRKKIQVQLSPQQQQQRADSSPVAEEKASPPVMVIAKPAMVTIPRAIQLEGAKDGSEDMLTTSALPITAEPDARVENPSKFLPVLLDKAPYTSQTASPSSSLESFGRGWNSAEDAWGDKEQISGVGEILYGMRAASMGRNNFSTSGYV